MTDRDIERLHQEAHDPYAEVARLRAANAELKVVLAQTRAQLLQAQMRLVELEFTEAQQELQTMKGEANEHAAG